MFQGLVDVSSPSDRELWRLGALRRIALRNPGWCFNEMVMKVEVMEALPAVVIMMRWITIMKLITVILIKVHFVSYDAA